LTGMVTSVPPYETFSLIKNNILHQSKIYKNHFENSNFCRVSHVTYSFKIILLISTGIFDDKLDPPTNFDGSAYRNFPFKCQVTYMISNICGFSIVCFNLKTTTLA
jgi:hypothetical protein